MTTFKTVKDSETEMTELMVPSYANFGGKVHGGVILSLMDKVAYVTAAKHANTYCVTVAVEGVEFYNPVEVGDLLQIKASVNYVGKTTMIVGMRVESLNPLTQQIKHTNSCYFTMAAKNQEGELISVPGLILNTEEQIRRFASGMALKKMSKERRLMLSSDLNHLDLTTIQSMLVTEKCTIL